jgi:hypothetical protein
VDEDGLYSSFGFRVWVKGFRVSWFSINFQTGVWIVEDKPGSRVALGAARHDQEEYPRRF